MIAYGVCIGSDERFARFAEHLARVRPTSDPAGDLLALGLAYRDSALDDPHFYRVMFGSAPAPASAPAPTPVAAGDAVGPEPEPGVHSREPFRMLEDAVGRLVPPERAAAGAYRLWALVHGLVSLELATCGLAVIQFSGKPARRGIPPLSLVTVEVVAREFVFRKLAKAPTLFEASQPAMVEFDRAYRLPRTFTPSTRPTPLIFAPRKS